MGLSRGRLQFGQTISASAAIRIPEATGETISYTLRITGRLISAQLVFLTLRNPFLAE